MTAPRRRVQKKSSKRVFDKYEYYHKAVQSAGEDVKFLRRVYKDIRKKEPTTLREDFCGTFALSKEWVQLNPKFKAVGVDLDPEPLEYGKSHHRDKLRPERQRRLRLVEGNVLHGHLPAADIAVAMNFSYFVFKSRELMKKYFTNAYRSLNKDGVFVIDTFGGSNAYDSNVETTRHKTFTYYWDQVGFDPVTNRALFYIHFKPHGQKKVERVFTYDWRVWSIPELRDLLAEVGFRRTHVYWEGTTDKGEGDGIFTRTEKGEACLSWIAYISAEK
jgi:SAM-dependent methyltransferase